MYDETNIFARILRKELSCKLVLEGEHFLAFHDIYPKAPVHVLVIPKGPYINDADFVSKASDEEIIGFHKGIVNVIEMLNINEHGYRLVSHNGENAGQEIFHYHVHILSGSEGI